MEDKKIILPTKRFIDADDQDLNVRLHIEETKTLLREGDRDIVLDLSQVFNRERNVSKSYKIFGKMKMIFRNIFLGNTDYRYLKDRLYLYNDGTTHDWSGYLPYDEFAFLRRDVLRENSVPERGSTLGVFNPNITLTTGNTGHLSITTATAPYHNWNIYLSYVNDKDSNHPMNYSLTGGLDYKFNASDGIPFRVEDYGSTYTLTSPVEHGINVGEYVTLYGGSLTGLTSGRTFYVDSVGNEIYRSDKFVINLSKYDLPTGTVLDTVIFGKRCIDVLNINTTTSEYYVHKHKTLTDINGYILDNVGFETPIWEDEYKMLYKNYSGVYEYLVNRNRMESVLFTFKEPLTLTGITNNLGYTPTEVYVTTIFRNGNGYFEYPPKVGYKFNFHDNWIDHQFSGSTSLETTIGSTTFTGNTNSYGYTGFTFTGGTPLPIGTVLTGAFVEYNDYELKERIISDAYHKITTPVNIFNYGQNDPLVYSGASNNNKVGLFYIPHTSVKLRQLSPYVETSTTKDVYNLPETVKYFPNESLWKWRDIYDHGYVDTDGYGTNYPFLNGEHAIRTDINFYLRNELGYKNKTDGLTGFNNNNTNNNNTNNKDC